MSARDDVETVTISRRFRGPPRSGNGGYCCGLLAARLGPSVEVTLKAPPPLDTVLEIKRNGDRLSLDDGATEIASARDAVLDLEIAAAPSLEEAEAARDRYAGFDEHLCAGCFVCGTERAPEDGLNIFAGPIEGRDMVAAPWVPSADLTNNTDGVATQFLWAALDCPGYFAFRKHPLAAVLGRMTGEVCRHPPVGEACIVCAWPILQEGRNWLAGSAIFDKSGELCAAACAVWIELSAADQEAFYAPDPAGT